jgi:membrane protein YqaA with SNARE-associated domain
LASSPESQLPPEAQGEVNGGPLGCCLGTIAGLFLTVLLLVSASLLFANGANISLATAPVALVGAVLGGYFGWKVGKKLYREYDPPVLKERRSKPRRV